MPAASRRRALAALLLAIGAGSLAAGCARPEAPPAPEVERARSALRRARIAAADLAPVELAAAVAASARLERRLAEGRDDRFALSPPEEVGRLAREAEATALAALVAARREGESRHAELDARHAELARRLAALDGYLDRTPADQRLHERFGRARLELEMAAAALSDAGHGDLGDLLSSRRRLDAAATELDALEGLLGERYARLRDPELIRRWQAWVDEALAGSRTNSRIAGRASAVAVVVDKLAGRCYLVQGGRVAAVFPAELGRNGLADKLYAGDEATPEGRYRVTAKRDGDSTEYHRALMLDYPTADDLRQFRAARGRGLVPAGRGPGGGIEIHGHGGRSINWTNGCVALRDEQMERLFAAVEVGTPVTIVGTASLAAGRPEDARP